MAHSFATVDIFLSFIVGYVFFPDGKKAGIEWSDAHLSNLADDHIIKDNYQICFTAGESSQMVFPPRVLMSRWGMWNK